MFATKYLRTAEPEWHDEESFDTAGLQEPPRSIMVGVHLPYQFKEDPHCGRCTNGMTPPLNGGWDVYIPVRNLRIRQETAFLNCVLSKFLLSAAGFAHFEAPSDRKFSCQEFWGALYTQK